MEMKPAKVIKFIETLSGGLQPNRMSKNRARLRQCCQAFEMDALARRVDNKGPFPDYPQSDRIIELYEFLCGIQIECPPEGEVWKGDQWKAAGNRLQQKRIKELRMKIERDRDPAPNF
jgi:hypothetical protein